MGGPVERKREAQRWGLWKAVIVVWLFTAMLGARSLYGQKPMAPPGGRATPAAPPAAPPARPAPASERVLELGLEEAIRLALQRNLEIERERYGPPIARTDVERNRAAYDPTVGMDTQIAQTKYLAQTPGTTSIFDLFNDSADRQFLKHGEITPWLRQKILLGGNYELRFINTRDNVAPERSRIIDPRYESRIQLSFTQPLLRDFGIAINTALIRQAEKAELIAEQQLLQILLDTVFSVQQSYWDLVFRIQDLAVKRESQKLAEDFLAENKIRVELGTLAPIELVQAQTRVKTSEGDVITAEAAVGDAEDQLKQVLNIPESAGTWQIRIQPTDSPPFVPIVSIPLEDKINLALKNRPDFMRSQLDIAAREIARDFARNQRLPRLDVVGRSSVGDYGSGFGESISKLSELDGYDWAIGLQFQYPLGNRLANNDYLRRNLEVQQALVDQRRLIHDIMRDIRQRIREIERTSKLVEVTRQASELARTQLEAEQEKFRLGLSTSFNVLQFQEDLSIARSEETRALNEYNVALAQLDRSTGRLQYGEVTTSTK